MPIPKGLPVVDHHCHLSPAGEGVGAAKRFRRAGGTHLFLATQNYRPEVPRTLAAYTEQFATTAELARTVAAEAGVTAFPVVAPYPIDLVAAAVPMGLAAALELHRAALDLAGEWVRERRAVALGEVGFPHFPVPEEVRTAAAEAFRHALTVARDVDCPVVIHSADLEPAGFHELAEMADRAGVPRERVVKHYARRRVSLAERSEVTPSYLARRDLVRDVLPDPGPWFLETDFLDDPTRPGAVLDLATVPRRASAFGASEAERDHLYVPFVESIERVYGIRPEVPSRGTA